MNAQTAVLDRPSQPLELAPPPSRGNIVPLAPQGSPKAYPPKIARALLSVTREIGAVGKLGENTFHKYHYQKWEDVLNVIAPLLTQHGIIVQQSEVARSLFENDQMMSITYAFTLINEDGDVWPDQPVWTSIARARDQKGIPDDKSANKCHTQAHKYFLLHLFKIRTAEIARDDSDGDGEQATNPKPPKPGSAEAQALDGPRTISSNGHNAETWASAFMLAVEKATPAELGQWVELNRNSLSQLEKYPDIDAKVKASIGKLRPAQAEAAKPPRPPKPGSAPAPTAEKTIPDPKANIRAFLGWLDTELAGFSDGEGEKANEFWNDVVQPRIDDLDGPTQEDCMGIWSRHEVRWN